MFCFPFFVRCLNRSTGRRVTASTQFRGLVDFSSLRTHFWPAHCMRLLYVDMAYVKQQILQGRF
jgi:hypothetical protein